MERVALYCRVSSDEQVKHGLSLAEQEHSLEEYAKAHKMKVVGKYIDAGISGRKRYTKRPEMLRLLEDVKADKIDTILFVKLDRWTRNVGSYYEIQDILDKHKVTWRATQEDYETVTASGRFKVNIMLSVAQDEADRTSERIKFVFDAKRERGEAVSGSVPYGYKIENKKIVKDEATAPIARRIFDVYMETGSPQKVIEAVPEKKLSYHRVLAIVKSEAYTGNYNGIKIDPIITIEEHERIMKSIKTPVRSNQTDRTYLFSGMLVCPRCGQRMRGICSPHKERDYLYYKCSNYADKRGCSQNHLYREDMIEAYLLERVDGKLGALANMKPAKSAPPHEKERKSITKKLSKLSELYVNDLIELPDYKRQYEQLQSALAAIPPEEKPRSYERTKQIFANGWKDLYMELDREGKRLFWRNALEEIKLGDRKVVDFIFR